ncbi:MAG: nitroreductase family protein [Candidatus Hydrogenedentes bacterium]|nr:nitroreductase family protein [Candidatus Hydrogenedentota bacterium]
MSLVQIDETKCARDGLCARDCPMGLLEMAPGGPPREIPEAESTCLACGHCAAICPTGALSLKGADPEQMPDGVRPRLAPEEVEQLLRTRRSVRVYKKEPVPRDVLRRVIESARWAPTATNRQGVNWLVVEDAEKVHRLAGMVVEGLRTIPYFTRAVQAWEEGQDMILRGAPHVLVAHAATDGFDPAIDSAIGMTYIELAAHAHGLGTCWAGVLMAAARLKREIPKFLEIPEKHKICAAMMIGYPEHEYKRIPARNELNVRLL